MTTFATAFLSKLATIAKRVGCETKTSIYRFAVRDRILSYTNGHFLYETACNLTERSFEISQLKLAADIAKAKKNKQMTEADIDAAESEWINEHGDYPDLRPINKTEDMNTFVRLNPRYLKDICDLAIASNSGIIQLSHGSPDKNGLVNKGIYLTWQDCNSDEGRRNRVLMMPMFIRDTKEELERVHSSLKLNPSDSEDLVGEDKTPEWLKALNEKEKASAS